MQGLLTNDVKQLVAREAPAQYAAILNSHGRHLHDLFLYRQPGSESTVSSARLHQTMPCADTISADHHLNLLQKTKWFFWQMWTSKA